MSASIASEITDEELDIALGNKQLSNNSDSLLRLEELDNINISIRENDLDSYDSLVAIRPAHEEACCYSFDVDDESDFFATTKRRLQDNDISLRTLEICNPMDWDCFDQWRDELGNVDAASLFLSFVELFTLAKHSPHVQRLELSNLQLDQPLLANAVIELFSCTNYHRCWSQWSIDECSWVAPDFLIKSLWQGNLKSLHLTNNHLSPNCIGALGDVLATNKYLRELRLTEHLTCSAMDPLAKGLMENDTLVRLDFLGSTFEDDVIQALAFGLEKNSGIRTLSLSHCGLPDIQLVPLVCSVIRHPSLIWLDLSSNRCGRSTCDALVSLILAGNDCSRLAGLSLVSCGIDDAAVARLTTVFRLNCTLKHLHLCENYISDKGIQCFASSLKGMRSLKTLWVSENNFRDAKSLLDAVQCNNELEQLILDRHVACFEEIQYQILLNKGGRRLLASHEAPLVIWPLVLERCQHIRHYCRQANRADVLYHLLRGGPALFDNPALKRSDSSF